MSNDINTLKFNLTKQVSNELIKFNNIKLKLNNLYLEYNNKKDDKTLLEIVKLEKELKESKNKFIEGFRKDNKTAIEEYKKIKYEE